MGVSFHSSGWRRSLIPVIVILVLACALRTIQYLGRGSFWATNYRWPCVSNNGRLRTSSRSRLAIVRWHPSDSLPP